MILRASTWCTGEVYGAEGAHELPSDSFLLQFQLTVMLFISFDCQSYRHREQFYNQSHPAERAVLLKETICCVLSQLLAPTLCLGAALVLCNQGGL